MGTETTTARVRPDLAIPPGELLHEELQARGMTQKELADRTGRPQQKISEIINGKKAITHDTAIELERVLGIPADFWVNLEASYQLTRARQRERIALEQELDWLDQFPHRELARRGCIAKTTDRLAQVKELLQFFGVTSFATLRSRQEAVLGFRVATAAEAKVDAGALWSWLRVGEMEAVSLTTEPFDEQRFRAALAAIRGLTGESVEVFYPRMQELCADAGVAFVIVQEFPKSAANGVARWLAPDKAMIQCSTLYKVVDIFWFSFFHEADHVLRRQRRRVFVNGVNDDPDAEQAADRFAADFLIPPEEWAAFSERGSFSRKAVQDFAAGIGAAPAIVVGRLQHEGLVPHRSGLNRLKPRFVWKEASAA